MTGFKDMAVVRTAMLGVILAAGVPSTAQAAPFFWTDWQGTDTCSGAQFCATGVLTTSTSSVTVNYTHSAGVSFYQTGQPGETDWWGPRNNPSSPYRSTTVDNEPTGTDIIALNPMGNQTLTFSQAIANPVFAFVSMNGNGYEFLNQDFNILSNAGQNFDGQGVDACGHWGCGTVRKEVQDIGNGNVLYKLIAVSGEPHGVIQFTGAFSTLSWKSNITENWNGFTVGVQGTAAEIIPTEPLPQQVPEPGSLLLIGSGLTLLMARARRRAR